MRQLLSIEIGYIRLGTVWQEIDAKGPHKFFLPDHAHGESCQICVLWIMLINQIKMPRAVKIRDFFGINRIISINLQCNNKIGNQISCWVLSH